MFGKILTQLSSYFVGGIVSKFENRFKNFSQILNYAGMGEDVNTYLSNILFISLIVFIFLEFTMILVMVKLNIMFSIFSFFITIMISFTFSGMVFLLLYRYPHYILDSKKKEIDFELENTIRHLSVLDDEVLTVKDILVLLSSFEQNKLLTKDAQKIINLSNLNLNLKDTLRQVVKETVSELEKNFFRKLIDVLDNKEKIGTVVTGFLDELEESRKVATEEKISRINLLFEVNVFLFFFVIVLLTSLFLVTLDQKTLKDLLMFIAIVFPIVEFVLIVILYK